jgi:hypothetical protein
MVKRDGKIYPGSGRPSNNSDATKKAQLQRKMDKKMTAMGEERKTKKKEK